MRLHQIQYFVTVCKYHNYTRAAEELFVSQPAISQAMKELEAECGVPLLRRKGNHIYITPEGELLCAEASSVLEHMDRLEHLVKDLHLQRNFVRIGMSTISGNAIFPGLRRYFHLQHPEMEVISQEHATSTLFQLLDADEADILLTAPIISEEELKKDYHYIKTNTPSLVYCVAKGHPYAGKKSVNCQEIAAAPITVMTGHSYPTQELKRNLAEAGLKPNIIHYTNQMYTVERFVESGASAGFLPEELVRNNPQLVALYYPWYRSDLSVMLLWKKEQTIYPSVEIFINAARRYLKNGNRSDGASSSPPREP